jgi:hypothetical protein
MRAKLQLNPSLVAFLAGGVFSIGLGVSRMTQPAKIQAFLDIAGDWDPSLLFVMGGAVVTSFLLFRLADRARRPLLAAEFTAPARSGIDGRLLGGAALFGLGWGLSGFCPGPAVTALVSLNPGVFVFAGTMTAGMAGYHWLESLGQRALGKPATAAAGEGCG